MNGRHDAHFWSGRHWAASTPFRALQCRDDHFSQDSPRSSCGDDRLKYSEANPDIKEKLDMAVFPRLQGGPHSHQIGALAAQLLEVDAPEFVQ